MILGAQKGVYNRWVFRFDSGFIHKDMRVIKDITPSGLNFVSLDSGICVCLNENEELEIFPIVAGSTKERYVSDKSLSGDMKLYKKGGKVVFAKGEKLYSLSLK